MKRASTKTWSAALGLIVVVGWVATHERRVNSDRGIGGQGEERVIFYKEDASGPPPPPQPNSRLALWQQMLRQIKHRADLPWPRQLVQDFRDVGRVLRAVGMGSGVYLVETNYKGGNVMGLRNGARVEVKFGAFPPDEKDVFKPWRRLLLSYRAHGYWIFWRDDCGLYQVAEIDTSNWRARWLTRAERREADWLGRIWVAEAIGRPDPPIRRNVDHENEDDIIRRRWPGPWRVRSLDGRKEFTFAIPDSLRMIRTDDWPLDVRQVGEVWQIAALTVEADAPFDPKAYDEQRSLYLKTDVTLFTYHRAANRVETFTVSGQTVPPLPFPAGRLHSFGATAPQVLPDGSGLVYVWLGEWTPRTDEIPTTLPMYAPSEGYLSYPRFPLEALVVARQGRPLQVIDFVVLYRDPNDRYSQYERNLVYAWMPEANGHLLEERITPGRVETFCGVGFFFSPCGRSEDAILYDRLRSLWQAEVK